MKLRFLKGLQTRTVIVKQRIVWIISGNMTPIRFDLNNFEKEKEKFANIQSQLKDEALKIFDKIATLTDDRNIMEDIQKDYEEDGWKSV